MAVLLDFQDSPSEARRLNLSVLILDKLFLRSWVEMNQVEKLQKNFNVTVLIPDNIENNYQISGVTFQTYSKIKTGRFESYLMTIYWIKNLSKSKSFKFNLERYILGNVNWGWSAKKNLEIMKRVLGFIILKPYHFLFFVKPIRIISEIFIKYKLKTKIDMMQSVFSNFQDAVLIPSSGGETELYVLIEYFRKIQVPTILCVDNWDNIYGKVALTTLPNFITVMGNTSVRAANQIHGFDTGNVAPIGIPRFDFYRNKLNYQSSIQRNMNLSILYLGFSLEHDEIQVINELFEKLYNNSNGVEFKIIYRPHPRRLRRAREVKLNPNVKISRSIELARESKSGMPTMDQSFYEELFEASVVIGAPTTMMLEAMAIGKPCILDLTDDGIHRTTSRKSYHKFSHMQDLESIPELPIAKSIDEIVDQIRSFERHATSAIDYSMSDVVNLEPRSYFEQLSEFILLTQGLSDPKSELQ